MYKPVQDQACGLDADAFTALYPEPVYVESLGFKPEKARHFKQIAAYAGLTVGHRAVLASQGFVAVGNSKTDTFGTAYLDLYTQHLPVMITTDSLLHALHRSYDGLLLEFESSLLMPAVDRVLAGMHQLLAQELAGLPAGLRPAGRELDMYLAVARSLLAGSPISTVGDDATAQVQVAQILTAIERLQPVQMTLFGVTSTQDMSQMKPRGHYTDQEDLRRYFQAMMWLGRTELPMVTFDPARKPKFNRRGLEAAAIASHLLDASGFAAEWGRVDEVLTVMIGEHDSMTPTDMRRYMADAGLRNLDALAKADDQQLYAALMRKAYGLQRIMSQVIATDPNDPQVALPRVFLLMGQRFTLDSHILGNVTFDRVLDLRTGAKVTRMLPSELDVQFVLGSNAAARHLRPELDKYGYQGVLHEMRFLVDAHPPSFWDANLYNGWLAAIRAAGDRSEFARWPAAMRTAAWADKTLNTQAAAWAELRHDTLLYVKQSYSAIPMCEYPDAYVEPVPAFYARMARMGRLGSAMMKKVGGLNESGNSGALRFFANLTAAGSTLEGIARKELAGTPLTKAEKEFLKATIEKEMVGCGAIQYDGWYGGLFHDNADVALFKPTIADIHTAPADENGTEKGWVLHAATGRPMMMVFTVEDCEGVKAYVGPISSYHSVLTERFARRSDEEWAAALAKGAAVRPAWTESFVR